jgi:hypothetical protein
VRGGESSGDCSSFGVPAQFSGARFVCVRMRPAGFPRRGRRKRAGAIWFRKS